MSDAGRSPWWLEPAAMLGALLLRALRATWRVERLNAAAVDHDRAAGRRVLYALWHAHMLPLIMVHAGEPAAAMVSRSRDGQLITRVIERLGYGAARGSSSRGGSEAVLEMLEWTRRGRSLAITPDGPRGPALRVKPGVAWLASRSGLRVIPVAAASRPAWRLDSWDRFLVPPPFSRVWIAYGEPLSVPGAVNDSEESAWAERLEQALGGLTRVLAERAGEVA